jgi:DNA-binding PadR family transcriptional regulator
VRLGRGDVRGALLVGLQPGPAHGYELIRRLEQSSGGAWSPSPGSVYPTLQLLADEGLLTPRTDGSRTVYSLTAAGRRAAAKAGPPPWRDQPAEGGGLREETHRMHAAAKQVGTQGSPELVAAATDIVRRARRELYELLARD